MAQKVVVSLVDDLDGGKADETIQFSLDGKHYEIDLSDNNATALHNTLASYIESARRPGTTNWNRSTSPSARPGIDYREQNQAIRDCGLPLVAWVAGAASVSEGVTPARGTTNASTTSARSGSGPPITAASATSGDRATRSRSPPMGRSGRGAW
jgi:hypothetical protein